MANIKQNMNTISKKNSNRIYYLYFVLTFMILAIHSLKIENFSSANNLAISINHILNILFNMAVPTFFMLSSILFFSKINEKTNYFDILKKKAKSLIIPYMLWNIIACPFKILKNYIIYGEFNVSLKSILYGIVMSNWDPVLWFLRVLFIYVLIYPIINFVSKKKIVCPIVIIIIIVINCFIGPTVGYSTCRYWLPIYLLGAYLINNFSHIIMTDKSSFDNKFVYFSYLLLFILFLILAYVNDYMLYMFRLFSPFLIWKISDVFLVNRNPNWFIKQTFFYYGAQLFIADFVSLIYIKIVGNGSYQLIIGTFLLPLINMLILIICARIFSNLFKKSYLMLTGNRGGKNEKK